MSAQALGWHAHISDRFEIDAKLVTFWRRLGDDRTEIIVGFDPDGRPVTDTIPVGVRPEFPGLAIPVDALQALAETVKPGPSSAEVGRLEDALTVERRRVDQVLDRTLPNRTTQDTPTRDYDPDEPF